MQTTGKQVHRQLKAHPFVLWMHRLITYLSQDFLGGPRVLKLSWVINFQKAGTLPFVLLLMWWYGNYSTAAWVYLALHGSYGLLWVMKDLTIPDRRWHVRVTLGGALMSFLLVLGLYWVAPFLLISGVLRPAQPPSSGLLGAAIALHTLGVVMMIAADWQKYYRLKYNPGLITDGMFRFIRHPNYLGEMIVYSSYALLVRHWIPWVILAWVWGTVFLTNMLTIEASLSGYPQWTEYKARTGMLLPRLFPPKSTLDDSEIR